MDTEVNTQVKYKAINRSALLTCIATVTTVISCATGFLAFRLNNTVTRYQNAATARDQQLVSLMCYDVDRISAVKSNLLNPFLGGGMESKTVTYYGQDLKQFEHQLGISSGGDATELNFNLPLTLSPH